MTNFHVGQKVVCIDAAERDETHPEANVIDGMDGLTKGAVYTIRSIQIDPGWGETTVCLSEIIRGRLSRFRGVEYEAGFSPERFRPVVERKTSIAIFHEILNKPRTGVPA